MSRNFELLERIAKEEWLGSRGVAAPPQPPIPFPALKGPARDEITKLVQRLFLQDSYADLPRAVSFAGMVREDRSSWICAHAAEYLASQVDGSVCLVDANLASPTLQSQYDLTNRAGLAAALVNDGSIRAFTSQLAIKNLWVLPAGNPKPGFEMNVSRCRARFAELREEFRYVLVSGPSLLHESEATLLGQMCDGVALIVEANQSRRDSIRQAKDRLEAAQVPLLGAVLDQRRFPIPDFLYRRL